MSFLYTVQLSGNISELLMSFRSHVSVPIIILGFDESIRLHISSFLLFSLQLRIQYFSACYSQTCHFSPLSGFSDDDVKIGWPGLSGKSESDKWSQVLDMLTIKDSNNDVEKLDIPQLTQCHDIFGLLNTQVM